MDVVRLSDGLIFTSVILAFLSIGEFLRAWLEVVIRYEMGESVINE